MKRVTSCLFFALAMILCAGSVNAYEALTGPTGVLKYDAAKAYDGYTLLTPNACKSSYLINNEGQIVHEWKTDYTPGRYAILLENGHLLRGAQLRKPNGSLERPANLAATAGFMQELDWDGNVVWDYKMSTPDEISHHGFYRMPNGNTLFIGFERVSKEEVKKLGRKHIFDGKVRVGRESTEDF